MKNVIEYYYNINVDKIIFSFEKYTVISNNIQYILVCIQKNIDLKTILETQKHPFFHKIITNKFGSIITRYDGNDYVFMRKTGHDNRKINFTDVLDVYYYDAFLSSLKDSRALWIRKIDTFESYKVKSDYMYKYREYFDYYIGMGENAISYSELCDKNKLKYSFTYNRFYQINDTDDLYNPFNITIDSNVKGLAEYIKYSFFYKEEVDISYIPYDSFTYDDSVMFISRLLFPTYFFDLCYEYQFEKCDEKIKNLLLKTHDYQKYIFQIILEIKRRYNNIPLIKWLDK